MKVLVTGSSGLIGSEAVTYYDREGYHVIGIHSYDVIQAFEAFRRNPQPGEVYNLGGGRFNSVSILEAFDLIESLTNRKVNWVYIDENRISDHICYISDLSKMKSHFPEWGITLSLQEILQEIVVAQGQHYVGV